MGQLNLLKGRYTGKVGETVGAKWKSKSTVRTYSAPANPSTQAQQLVRGAFKEMTSFVALFADSIKYLSALDTSGMSLRNAIIKLNKEQIADGTFDKADLLISKGGLQKPSIAGATASAGVITVTWTAPTATNFTDNAKLIAVFVDAQNSIVEVKEVAYNALTVSSSDLFDASTAIDVYCYYLDKRGSSKIASLNTYNAVSA